MQEKKLKPINTRDMTVTFENPLGNGEFYFAKEVFFEDTAEIAVVMWRARAMLDDYNLDFVRFSFKGSNYLVAKEKEKKDKR